VDFDALVWRIAFVTPLVVLGEGVEDFVNDAGFIATEGDGAGDCYCEIFWHEVFLLMNAAGRKYAKSRAGELHHHTSEWVARSMIYAIETVSFTGNTPETYRDNAKIAQVLSN